ncbi:uncharacterized protein N7483_000829, partial [Penicillium malachiteum]|uniref:uncharacterized protein n=1 Tax=Penicillium malachiteum TaxID=1324776 RepID=UPI002546F5F9
TATSASLPAGKMSGDMTADRGPGIIAGNLTVAILATIAVILRFIARSMKGCVFGLDDWLILLALPFGWGMAISTIICVRHGLGKHLAVVEAEDPTQLFVEGKAYYASELIWTISIPIIKTSILLFYIRIFGKMKSLRYTAYGLMSFTFAWAIMVIFVIVFQCNPVAKGYNAELPGKCINSWLFFVLGSSMNCATDLVILILPMPLIWKLQLSRMQRVSLLGIFVLGSLSCVFGLVRLGTIVREKNSVDETWALSNVAIWSTAEPCLGITAACMPVLRPLFTSAISVVTRKSTNSDSPSSFSHHQKLQSNDFSSQQSQPGQLLSDLGADIDLEADLSRDSNDAQQKALPHQWIQ